MFPSFSWWHSWGKDWSLFPVNTVYSYIHFVNFCCYTLTYNVYDSTRNKQEMLCQAWLLIILYSCVVCSGWTFEQLLNAFRVAFDYLAAISYIFIITYYR